MKKCHVNDINKKLFEDEQNFIKFSNADYRVELMEIAESIAEHYKEKPILLLSGPSGSGKTTTARIIEDILDHNGITTHTISMDNYFLPSEHFHKALDENGKVDYESPKRIDIPKLNKHIKMLANGEEITVPKFNFHDQTSADGYKLKIHGNEIIVFEGIHALNPAVIESAEDCSRCMYVSVRTRIEYGSNKILHPKYIRLMRRILRDKLYRGRSIEQTLDMFDSVEAGENKYIMPYKNRAEFSVDTFIPYEVSAYKGFLENELASASKTYADFQRFEPMLEALRNIRGIGTDNIPDNSLVREFIGGSKYGD